MGHQIQRPLEPQPLHELIQCLAEEAFEHAVEMEWGKGGRLGDVRETQGLGEVADDRNLVAELGDERMEVEHDVAVLGLHCPQVVVEHAFELPLRGRCGVTPELLNPWARQQFRRGAVGNLVIEPQANGDVLARTAFLIYRSHLETDQQLFAGSREDVLRRVDGAWRVAKRTIVLDANVLLDKNLSIFF